MKEFARFVLRFWLSMIPPAIGTGVVVWALLGPLNFNVSGAALLMATVAYFFEIAPEPEDLDA